MCVCVCVYVCTCVCVCACLPPSHTQTRKLCVDLCAVLFSRSRCFRQLLTQQFTTFVELAVGHRSAGCLPGRKTGGFGAQERCSAHHAIQQPYDKGVVQLLVEQSHNTAWGSQLLTLLPTAAAMYIFLRLLKRAQTCSPS